MSLVDLEERKPVFPFRMEGTGLFNLDFLAALRVAVDGVEVSVGPACLVITGAEKSFSAGFDLEALPQEAGDLAIVDASASAEALLDRATSMVAPLADKDRATYSALKRGLYRHALEIVEAG